MTYLVKQLTSLNTNHVKSKYQYNNHQLEERAGSWAAGRTHQSFGVPSGRKDLHTTAIYCSSGSTTSTMRHHQHHLQLHGFTPPNRTETINFCKRKAFIIRLWPLTFTAGPFPTPRIHTEAQDRHQTQAQVFAWIRLSHLRALFSMFFLSHQIFGMEFLVKRTCKGGEGAPHGQRIIFLGIFSVQQQLGLVPCQDPVAKGYYWGMGGYAYTISCKKAQGPRPEP